MSVSASPARALRRVLPFRSVVSTSTGLAYAAISLLACIQLAAFLAGDSAWIALLVAGALAVLAAFCFSELNALCPSAAAIRQCIRTAFGERASLAIAFGYVVTIVAVIAADSYVAGSAISFVFNIGAPNQARSAVPQMLAAMLLTGVMTFIRSHPLLREAMLLQSTSDEG